MFDHALLIGMSSDEYWFGDPSLIFNYENAFNLKQMYDLQLAWTYGTYFKSALASTQLWTIEPAKESEWNKMPKYADYPIKTFAKKDMSKEQIQLRENAREKLSALGLLREA